MRTRVPTLALALLLACAPHLNAEENAPSTVPPSAPEASDAAPSPLARALDSLQRPLVLETLDVPADAPLGEREENDRLEALPSVRIPVQEASLGSAVTLIAAAAGMNFIAPPPDEFPETVSLFVTANPWSLLRQLSERYRFSMAYAGGVWVFTRSRPGELVAETHLLRHGNLDTFEAAQNSVALVGSDKEGGDTSAGAGGPVFSARTERLVRDIRELIGAGGGGAEAAGSGLQQNAGAEGRARVVHLPERNALLVVATPASQELVRSYLERVDTAARQIRIEARFIETSHDPRQVIGIDPSSFQPSVSLADLTQKVDLNRLGSLRLPQQALLSADTLTLQLNALRSDDRSRVVNEPSVTTSENREVYLSVGTEEPFAAATLTNTGDAGGALGTSQSSVAFRRVGTTLNVLPTVFEGENGGRPRIRLTVQVEVGSLAGFRRIAGSDVPRVQSQRYLFTVVVPEGETLAFGGLSGVAEAQGERGVPLLSSIPVAGALFRSRSRSNSQRNLIAYITPRIVESGAE